MTSFECGRWAKVFEGSLNAGEGWLNTYSWEDVDHDAHLQLPRLFKLPVYVTS